MTCEHARNAMMSDLELKKASIRENELKINAELWKSERDKIGSDLQSARSNYDLAYGKVVWHSKDCPDCSRLVRENQQRLSN